MTTLPHQGSTRGARRLRLTPGQKEAVNRFIFDVLLVQGPPPLNRDRMLRITEEQHWQSYQCWSRGGHEWMALGQGGTGQMAALCWYQHVYHPGSNEWRPAKIIPAIVEAASRSSGREDG